jgi:hypothetical protein
VNIPTLAVSSFEARKTPENAGGAPDYVHAFRSLHRSPRKVS